MSYACTKEGVMTIRGLQISLLKILIRLHLINKTYDSFSSTSTVPIPVQSVYLDASSLDLHPFVFTATAITTKGGIITLPVDRDAYNSTDITLNHVVESAGARKIGADVCMEKIIKKDRHQKTKKNDHYDAVE